MSSRKILCVQFEIETLIEERSRKIYSKVFPKLIATDGRGASGSESFLHPVTLSSQKMHVSTDEFPSNGASLKSPNPLHHFKKMREGVCLPHGGFNSSITESESKESKESTEAEDHNHPHLRANSFARYSTAKRSIVILFRTLIYETAGLIKREGLININHCLAPLLDLNTNGGRRIVNILKN